MSFTRSLDTKPIYKNPIVYLYKSKQVENKINNLQQHQKYQIFRDKYNERGARLLTENYKTLREKGLNKWRNILCSWIRIFNIVKMTVLSKFVNIFNKNTIKLPVGCVYVCVCMYGK